MKISGKTTGLDAHIRRLGEIVREVPGEMLGILAEQGRALAIEYARETGPRGMQETPGDKQLEKIRGVVKRTFASRSNFGQVYALLRTIDRGLAFRYGRFYRKGNARGMAAVLREANIPFGTPFTAYMTRRKAELKDSSVRDTPPSSIASEAEIDRFVRGRYRKVGLAKAGWYLAGTQLGGRIRTTVTINGRRKTSDVFPGYVRKVAKAFPQAGGARVLIRDNLVMAEIFTNVAYALSALPADKLKRATQAGQERYQRNVAAKLSKLHRRKFR